MQFSDVEIMPLVLSHGRCRSFHSVSCRFRYAMKNSTEISAKQLHDGIGTVLPPQIVGSGAVFFEAEGPYSEFHRGVDRCRYELSRKLKGTAKYFHCRFRENEGFFTGHSWAVLYVLKNSVEGLDGSGELFTLFSVRVATIFSQQCGLTRPILKISQARIWNSSQ